MVLTRLDGDDVPKKKRSAKPASGRQALQDKGLVVVDNFMCWINSELDDNVG